MRVKRFGIKKAGVYQKRLLLILNPEIYGYGADGALAAA
jgi:hypothetical protein